jgi:uncharacterized heparinase superfamily protein
MFARVAHTSADELKFRIVEQARVAAEAARYIAGCRWRRGKLASRLLPCSGALERARHAITGADWGGADAALRAHFLQRAPRFLLNPADRLQLSAAAREAFPSATAAAAQRAAPLLEGRYDLLGFEHLSFQRGDTPVDWHFDPVHGRRAPVDFWARIPYLDPRCGDHKIIWELNRHQHWLALGRAAWLTGEDRYAAACATELGSWMRANPPLTGINWASMLELAFRSISWMWAIQFFVPFEHAGKPGWIVDLLLGLERQLEHVGRHLSSYFSPNTHLLGEALALYVGGRLLPELRPAARWERVGRAVLLHESRAQVNPEGSHAEQSPHYHRYALDFYLLALAVARKTEDAAAGQFAEIASRMASFCRAIADSNGRLPTIGDDDGGLLFPICGRTPDDVRDSLALAAALLRRQELAIDAPPEEVFWMSGGDVTAFVHPLEPSPPQCPTSQVFSDTGYVVFDSPAGHSILDAGPHGFLNGGHAHADALSFVLTVGGRPLLIDPGTASYTDPALRDRFRSTAMHNTVVMDGRQQAQPSGRFHWHSRANGHVDLWRPASQIPTPDQGELSPDHTPGNIASDMPFDYVEALHDGYSPLVHRRGLLRMPDDLWFVVDHLQGNGRHAAEIYWHFDPAWRLNREKESVTQLIHDDGLHAVLASTARQRETFLGDNEGIGWCSPRYGRVVPSLTVRYSKTDDTPMSLCTAIAASATPFRLDIQSAPVNAAPGSAWHSVAAVVDYSDSAFIMLVAMPRLGGGKSDRPLQRVAVGSGTLTTNARVCVLRLSRSGEPLSLTLIDAKDATWAGPHAFTVRTSSSARDLHLGTRALRWLNRRSEARPVA